MKTKSKKEPVECICPLCNETHYLKIFWSGKLPGRKHCKRCKDICAGVEYYNPCTYNSRHSESPEVLDMYR